MKSETINQAKNRIQALEKEILEAVLRFNEDCDLRLREIIIVESEPNGMDYKRRIIGICVVASIK